MHIIEIEKAIEEWPFRIELQSCVHILLQAVNDWPTNIESTEQFLQQLGMAVDGELNEANIRARLSTIEFSTEAWLAESLEELTEIFAFFPQGTSIISIISSIEDELSGKRQN
ncbi:hypothetical protein GTP58_06465 [Duganella sp. CY15W]|uniref:hypothetical protein n=1 Tax=Duganella sp. CY15W TaxID=2692172 RepID=UPI00136E4E72|nr:hypothetical protein [Duganella sp. CY15W]MYM27961.1 hypothetical protein [Duganella sp. CY15W]